jgi:hypothetical protein
MIEDIKPVSIPFRFQKENTVANTNDKSNIDSASEKTPLVNNQLVQDSTIIITQKINHTAKKSTLPKKIKSDLPMLSAVHEYITKNQKQQSKANRGDFIKRVSSIAQHGKDTNLNQPKINGFKPETWKRLSDVKDNLTKENVGIVNSIGGSKAKNHQNTSEIMLARLLFSLNHNHPSDAKKLLQDIDKKNRSSRPLPNIESVTLILGKSKYLRTASEIQSIDDYLRTLAVFESKPDHIISQLCYELISEGLDEGGRLFRQGEVGTKFYFILKGSIKLSVVRAPYSPLDLDAPQSFLAIMKAGEKFGDQALLNDLTRGTFAYGNEPNTVVLTLEKEPFLRLMGASHNLDIKNRIFLLKKFPFTANLDMEGLKIV